MLHGIWGCRLNWSARGALAASCRAAEVAPSLAIGSFVFLGSRSSRYLVPRRSAVCACTCAPCATHASLRGRRAGGSAPQSKFWFLVQIQITNNPVPSKGGGSRIASIRTTSFCTSGCFCGYHMWVEKT
jgi:hypothetical protein